MICVQAEEDSDEEDPLDAYMSGIEKQMEKEKSKVPITDTAALETKTKGIRADIDDEDDEESYYR